MATLFEKIDKKNSKKLVSKTKLEHKKKERVNVVNVSDFEKNKTSVEIFLLVIWD